MFCITLSHHWAGLLLLQFIEVSGLSLLHGSLDLDWVIAALIYFFSDSLVDLLLSCCMSQFRPSFSCWLDGITFESLIIYFGDFKLFGNGLLTLPILVASCRYITDVITSMVLCYTHLNALRSSAFIELLTQWWCCWRFISGTWLILSFLR